MTSGDRYTYASLRLHPGASWSDAARELQGEGVLATWCGEIGVSSDEGVRITQGEGTAPHGGLVTVTGVEELESTIRPRTALTITEPGVYAHRRFELLAEDWEEFLALSAAAWPDFEAVNTGCRILGLWRTATPAPGLVSALLVTRYPSLAAWEKSRPYAPQPLDEDKLDSWVAARAAFARRAQLTRRSIVRTYRLLSGP